MPQIIKWEIVECGGSYQRPFLIKSGSKVIASIQGDQLNPTGQSIGEARKNAAIISYVPQMVEALQKIASYETQSTEYVKSATLIDIARNVLSKMGVS